MDKWNQIVAEHGPAVYRVARRILGHADDADDVCQEVFCEVLRLMSAGTITNLPGLVRRLASFRSLDQLRKRRPKVTLEESVAARDQDGPVKVAISNELSMRLRQALTQLPPQQATVFSLRYFENMTNAEIAKSLDTSATAVSTSLSKARETLSDLLGITHHGN